MSERGVNGRARLKQRLERVDRFPPFSFGCHGAVALVQDYSSTKQSKSSNFVRLSDFVGQIQTVLKFRRIQLFLWHQGVKWLSESLKSKNS